MNRLGKKMFFKMLFEIIQFVIFKFQLRNYRLELDLIISFSYNINM